MKEEKLKQMISKNSKIGNEIIVKKNKSYGNAFFEEGNFITCYYDLKRKWVRLNQILEMGNVKNYEQIEDIPDFKDTLIDLMNYCNLTLTLLEEKMNGN